MARVLLWIGRRQSHIISSTTKTRSAGPTTGVPSTCLRTPSLLLEKAKSPAVRARSSVSATRCIGRRSHPGECRPFSSGAAGCYALSTRLAILLAKQKFIPLRPCQVSAHDRAQLLCRGSCIN